MIRPVDFTFGRAMATAAAAPAPARTAATAAAGTKDTAIADAAKQFEGVFMSMLVNEMFKGTDIIGSGSPYAGLVTQQLGDAMANAGGIGLASMITRQMEGTK